MADITLSLDDRAAIHDLMARYAQGVDRRDWELVRSTFHPDAHDDHGEYKGGVDGFIAWVTTRHAKVVQSMHFLGNCLIEPLGPDTVLVETYYIARQTYGADAAAARTMIAGAGGDGPVEAEIWGRYIDVAERRNGEWRTAQRTVAFEVVQAHAKSSLPLSSRWAHGQRDPGDPLYDMRRKGIAMAEARRQQGGAR